MPSFTKIVLLFLGILFPLASAFSQDSINTFSYDKKREKATSLSIYKCESGEYDELIDLSTKYLKKWKKKNIGQPSEYTQIELLQARADYAIMHFEAAEKLVAEAGKKYFEFKNVLSRKEKTLSTLFIAIYYYEVGNYVAAEKFCNIADSIAKTNTSEYLQDDILLLKSKILFHQEYYDEALTLIGQQYDYRLKMASAAMVENKDRLYINLKYDFQVRKERFADLVNLKAAVYSKKELYTEATLALTNNKDWMEKNLSKNSIYYRNLLTIEADNASAKNSNEKAGVLYQSAYTTYDCEEDEVNKINNLSETIISYTKAGDVIRAQNYLRRLQMHAFQYVGKTERYEIAYDYTLAEIFFLKGELEPASSRLAAFLKVSSGMPVYHSHYLKVKELQSLIARKSNDVKGLNKTEVEIAEIKGMYYGRNTPAYHKTLLNIAIEEIRYGSKFNYAEIIFRNSYDGFLKQKIQTNSKENSYYLTAYAELFLKTDRFDSAMAKAKQVAKINTIVYGAKSVEYLLALANFSEYSILAGKYQEGLDSLKKVTVLSDMKTGDIVMRQRVLLSIARLNKLFGEYDKSKDISNSAYKLNKESNYDQDILVQVESDEQMSDLYIQTENYFKAEKILRKSLTNINATLGDKSPKLIPVYFGYTDYNLTTGNLNQSDVYLSKAKQLIDSIYGSNSVPMSEYYSLAGDYYTLINDFKKAEEAYTKADKIQSQKLGKKHLKRAEIILSLASLHSKQNTYKPSDVGKLYTEALDIVKTTIGSASPLYAEIEEEYAEFLITTGSYDQADKLLEEADKFWTSKLGNENRHVAYINLLRGDVAYAKNKYDEAEKRYTKAKNNYLSVFSDIHPGYIKAVGKLARVYYMKKQPDKTLDAMNEIIPKYLDYTRTNFPSLSFRQKSNYWKDLKDEFEFYAFVALQQPSKGSNLKYTGNVYNNILATKALLLSSSIKLLDKIQNSNDSTLISLYNEWIAGKEYMVSILSLSKSQLSDQGINVGEIQSNTERLEKQMSQRSEIFTKGNAEKQITWEDVRSKLFPKEYAVEIIRFRYFNKVFTDSVIYAALIVEKATNDNPDIVILPDGKKMEGRYLKYYRNTATLNAPDEYSYSVYWQPIKNKIPDSALVYISSDGVYTQLNLEMLPVKGTENYVIDQNKLVLLTNTKDLLAMEQMSSNAANTKKKVKENKKSASDKYVLCGSPTFYTNDKIAKKNIPDLPGAEKEITELNTLLTSSDKTSLVLLKNSITEDTMKSIKSPKVLHIATHGYFRESSAKGINEDDIATHPLLNSGLMLLGSGDIVDNPDNKYVNQKDGILTAYEAMDLPLDNTDIVILSACETGRGEVQVGEGVYGLQRAFLIAGAKAIVISLFKVNDEVTQKLMLSFYGKWLKTGDKRQAFLDAKKEIKQKYKVPLYWGAFIMIEGRPERYYSNANQ
jgi:CHAT domain-containing protein/predicted negative regulator of RcsB-dependent stress response